MAVNDTNMNRLGPPDPGTGTEPSEQEAPRRRNPEQTRRRILEAATADFARRGMDGARIDDIAAASGSNKRMIYHYFGSKTELFQAVLEGLYEGICETAARIDIDELPPREALRAFIRTIWAFYRDNPEVITLLNSENLHQAKHIRESQAVRDMQAPFENIIARLLVRGREAGLFVADVDPVDLYISIAGLLYYYRSNQYTLSVFFGRNLSDAAEQERWCDHVDHVVSGFLCSPAAVAPSKNGS